MNVIVIIWILVLAIILALTIYGGRKIYIMLGGEEDSESTRIETKSYVINPVELIA